MWIEYRLQDMSIYILLGRVYVPYQRIRHKAFIHVTMVAWKMIDIATLSLQKQKLQRILEINKPITYGIISVSIGHDHATPRFLHMLKQRPCVRLNTNGLQVCVM
jgi:hypothetical protein